MTIMGIDETIDLYEEAVTVWGSDAQLDQLMEECAELIIAVNHYKRGRANKEKLAEELADVLIMCEQITITVAGPGLVDNKMEFKLNRLKQRVEQTKVLLSNDS